MRSSERESRAVRNEDGATAVEYALMLMLVFLVVFASVEALGLSVAQVFADFNALLF